MVVPLSRYFWEICINLINKLISRKNMVRRTCFYMGNILYNTFFCISLIMFCCSLKICLFCLIVFNFAFILYCMQPFTNVTLVVWMAISHWQSPESENRPCPSSKVATIRNLNICIHPRWSLLNKQNSYNKNIINFRKKSKMFKPSKGY